MSRLQTLEEIMSNFGGTSRDFVQHGYGMFQNCLIDYPGVIPDYYHCAK